MEVTVLWPSQNPAARPMGHRRTKERAKYLPATVLDDGERIGEW